MIRNQPTQEGIRYTDGKKINLNLLKAEIDRKMLKINMFINNITELGTPVNKRNRQKLRHQSIQTDKVYNKTQNQQDIFTNFVADQTFPKACNDFETSQVCNAKKVLGQSMEQMRNKSNSVFVQTKTSLEDVKTNKTIQDYGAQTLQQSDLELSKISEIKYISPIKFIKYPRTDRTQRSCNKKTKEQYRILVSTQKMAKLQAEVKETISKNRKEVDPQLRQNLIKKIQEKFKANLYKQKNF